MRIIVWGINYAPESTGIGPFNTGLAEWLAAQGHEVEMVTTFPYYPEWRKQARDRGRLFRTERAGGVTVRRCWHFVPARLTALRRILHEASFLGTSLLRVLTLRRADVVVAVSPPLALAVPAWLVTRIWRRSYVFHVQDLQPDAAVGLGMLRPGRFTRMLYALERFAYRRAALVSGISDGMLAAFATKGVSESRRAYFPNWVADVLPEAPTLAAQSAARAAFGRRHGIPPGAFLLVYSGNVGMKQGLGVLLDAAAVAAPGGRELCWVVVGTGAGKEALARAAAERGVAAVRLLPLQTEDLFVEMLIATDVCVITQQKGSGQYFFPSKLLTALGRSKPVLAVADAGSELARAVVAGGFGLVAPPDDPAAVARAAAEMASAGPAQLAQWGLNGRAWVGRFRQTAVLGAYERSLVQVGARARR